MSKALNNPEKSAKRSLYLIITLCIMLIVSLGVYSSNKANRMAVSAITSTLTPRPLPTPIPSSTPTLMPTLEVESVFATIMDEDAPEPEPTPVEFTEPSKGEVITPFSVDELIYNKSMGDWRVHIGTDYSGEDSTSVLACADGSVTDISTDEYYGTKITIQHGDGYVSAYYIGNTTEQDSELKIKIGDFVSMGQVIGNVSDSATFEYSLPPHLHFELYKDNFPMELPI